MTRRTFIQLSSVALCVERSAQAAVLGRSPYLQRLLAHTATLLWTTPQSGSGTVLITGPNSNSSSFSATVRPFLPADTLLPEAFYLYQADVTGLQPGTEYSYVVLVNGQVLADNPGQTFITPTPGPFSFLTFGDSGSDSTEQVSLIQRMNAEPGITKVIHVGDLAYESGTFAQFENNYFGLNASLMRRMPFFATPGNHEYETDLAAPYLAGHVAPVCGVPTADLGRYYSFDWGDAHFVSVDSNLLPTNGAQRMLSWLDNDLAASGKYWKIVFLHHPPYPTGAHLNDPICALVHKDVNPIVERHGVQLVLSGHEHGYERSYPLAGDQPVGAALPSTTYVISGGGGMTLEKVGSLPQCALSVAAFNYVRVDVAGPELTVKAIGLDGGTLDVFSLNPVPAIAPNGVLNAGDFTPNVASGSLVSIFGQNLAIRPATSSNFPLPTQLGGLAVSVNGENVPLLYVSPTQINLQMPYAASGQVNLQVTTANGQASAQLAVAPTAPAILAIVSGAALVSPANPCQAGGEVTLYMTGLGAPSEPVTTGQAAPQSPNPVLARVQILLGRRALQPSYAGMSPGFAGVSQVNFTLPPDLFEGTYTMRVEAGGAVSQPSDLIVGSVSGDGTIGKKRLITAVHPATEPIFQFTSH